MKPQLNGKAVDLAMHPRGARDLGVIVECHNLVCAIPVRWVSRLAMMEEGTRVASSVVEFGGEPHAVWDLGERLGLSPLDSAWVLLRVPHRAVQVPVALRTGTCLVVQPLPERVDLPHTLFAGKKNAVAGVFIAAESHGGALYGLELDIPHLWSEAELEASASLLRGDRAR